MKHVLFIGGTILALILTIGGAEELVRQVSAAEGFKSSAIALLLSLGFALLGPAIFCALICLAPKSERSET